MINRDDLSSKKKYLVLIKQKVIQTCQNLQDLQ